jgi:hypothetical protein
MLLMQIPIVAKHACCVVPCCFTIDMLIQSCCHNSRVIIDNRETYLGQNEIGGVFCAQYSLVQTPQKIKIDQKTVFQYHGQPASILEARMTEKN